MTEWVSTGDDFIAADVIRWKEGAYLNRYKKKRKATRLGERLVIAQVLRDEAGWVYLLVLSCEAVSAYIGRNISDVPMLPKDKEIPRKRATILRGKPERLLWSDESARALVASKFLDNP